MPNNQMSNSANTPITAPYGSWPSPLSADQLAAGAISRNEPRLLGNTVIWAERRPAEQGRTTLVYAHLAGSIGQTPQPQPRDLTDMNLADINTRVHEYGGGAWLPLPSSAGAEVPVVLGVNALDEQRIWLFDQHGGRPITPKPGNGTQWRYADPACLPNRDTTVWVREIHASAPANQAKSANQTEPASQAEPVNQIVSVDLDGTVAVLAEGADFYASPQPSPDGSRLAFVSWDHPNMPWDSTRLHVIDLRTAQGEVAQAALQGGAAQATAQGGGAQHKPGESGALVGVVLEGPAIQQPRWSPDGQLYAVLETASPAGGQPGGGRPGGGSPGGDAYWDIVQVDLVSNTATPLVDRRQSGHEWASEIEFGVPSWVFANQTYAWFHEPESGSLWCTWVDRGVGHIGTIASGPQADGQHAGAQLTEVRSGFTEFGRLEVTPAGNAVTVASSWTTPAAVVEISPDGSHRRLSETNTAPLDEAAISVPQAIEFATPTRTTTRTAAPPATQPTAQPTAEPAGHTIAHGFYFPPASATHQGPANELPPLLVLSHGGPTSRARSCMDLGIQYWTSRGIGVVDVNYRGSTGYGSAYRNALAGLWGVADVDDCVAAAQHLSGAAERGTALADPNRLAIKGGSAGGFTTLCALLDSDIFAAGLSRYGVADLASLASDTHKFESRYLDSLIGPWPAEAELYRQRSPLYRRELLRTAMLVLQGDQDMVVPPSQSEQLVAALAAAGVPHCYLLFEGEAHGFRKEKNIIAAIEAELSFLSQVLGFQIADQIEPVAIVRPAADRTAHPTAAGRTTAVNKPA